MSWQEHITVNPSVMHGIIRSYPSLTHEAIQATLAYAAELAQERVLPLPA